MAFVWRQISDGNTQLVLSVLIGFAAGECLVALWAATASGHWFWRWLAVWAAVMLTIPVGAWELTWIFSFAACWIMLIATAGRWMVRRIAQKNRGIRAPPAGRYRYSLRDLLLVTLLVGLWLPGLAAAARQASQRQWLSWLAMSACLAGLAVMSAKLVYGPRRLRALMLVAVALPLGAVAMFHTANMTYIFMVVGGSGTYAEIVAGLCVVGLEFVLAVAGGLVLTRLCGAGGRPPVQRAAAIAVLSVVGGVWVVWLGWVYAELLKRPPTVAKFELPDNHYERIAEIAQRVAAINRHSASIASLRSIAPTSATAAELETLYGELLPLLDHENHVPYDPARDGTMEYVQTSVARVQALRSLCRSLQAESESAIVQRQPERAADYALACMRLSQMEGRGGLAISALVGRALEGVAYAQLAKVRDVLPAAKRREIIAALADDAQRRDEIAVLRPRELDYSDRAARFSARLENTFWSLRGQKPPWEAAYLESARRHGATNAMLRADFAVRLFREQHARLPRGLDELVPDCLKEPPLDPYSGKPVCWRVEGDEFVIYSVGRDGEDNGGSFGNAKTYWSSVRGYDFDLDTFTRP